MHLPDSVLSAPVLVGGAALAAGGVALGLRRMDIDRVPQVAVLASALFVASLVHVPVPPTSAHLVLNGLAGAVLGWSVFPAMLIALLLQAILYGHGGLAGLGVNTVTMALPGVIVWQLFRGGMVRSPSRPAVFAFGALAGGLAVAMAIGLTALALLASGREYRTVALTAVVAHLPVMAVEAVVTGFVVTFVRKVRPELLGARCGFGQPA
ncbi:MAG TPA: cobalt transporter CbiM [Phycisphaerae bacterium]|nr:cobalt transporter CbiM [Phycisphaerae bacterium]HOI56924.1 cobalt transporter CbiM [Phycisphaerae bacterium]